MIIVTYISTMLTDLPTELIYIIISSNTSISSIQHLSHTSHRLYQIIDLIFWQSIIRIEYASPQLKLISIDGIHWIIDDNEWNHYSLSIIIAKLINVTSISIGTDNGASMLNMLLLYGNYINV